MAVAFRLPEGAIYIYIYDFYRVQYMLTFNHLQPWTPEFHHPQLVSVRPKNGRVGAIVGCPRPSRRESPSTRALQGLHNA